MSIQITAYNNSKNKLLQKTPAPLIYRFLHYNPTLLSNDLSLPCLRVVLQPPGCSQLRSSIIT
jgi:hypothetical protein